MARHPDAVTRILALVILAARLTEPVCDPGELVPSSMRTIGFAVPHERLQAQQNDETNLEEERYSLRKADHDIEPITTLKWTRQYIHCKPFVLVPDITLTIGLYQQPTTEGAIGEVLEARERKHREVEIGQAQAWYYPADTTIVLWGCFLHEFARDKSLLEDPNMKALWEHVSHFLQERYSEATRITTPFHDPLFDNEVYHAFLRSLGYGPLAKAAWGKPIEQAWVTQEGTIGATIAL